MDKPQPFTCALCGKIFSKKFNLARHVKFHYINKLPFTCHLCPKKYSRRNDLDYHQKTVHQPSPEQTFICSLCDKVFNNRKLLVRHIELTRNHESFECSHCNQTFQLRSSLVKHVRSCGIDGKKKSISNVNRFKCGICNMVFDSKIRINKHYHHVHEITLKIKTLTLKSVEEFNLWKCNTEHQTLTRFVKQQSWESKIHKRIVFVCHRSSINRTHSRSKTNYKFSKQRGSKKLESFCPAQIMVSINKADGTCAIDYNTTHLGHSSNDSKELQQVHLMEQKQTDKTRINVSSDESVPVVDVVYTCSDGEQLIDEDVIEEGNNVNSCPVMDDAVFQRIRKDAHYSLDRGLEAARIHGPDFLRKCVEEYVEQINLVAEVQTIINKQENTLQIENEKCNGKIK